MADEFLLYISAALDLSDERDVISRAVVEIPTSLGWRLVHTPHPGEIPDLDSVARADMHLLLIGGDIRAPIGMEWYASRRAGNQPRLLLKQGVVRTPAAQVFVRELVDFATWLPFDTHSHLRQQVLQMLASQILERAAHFQLSDEEYQRLQTWQMQLRNGALTLQERTGGGTGESSVIFSPERFTPSGGVLLEPPTEESEG